MSIYQLLPKEFPNIVKNIFDCWQKLCVKAFPALGPPLTSQHKWPCIYYLQSSNYWKLVANLLVNHKSKNSHHSSTSVVKLDSTLWKLSLLVKLVPSKVDVSITEVTSEFRLASYVFYSGENGDVEETEDDTIPCDGWRDDCFVIFLEGSGCAWRKIKPSFCSLPIFVEWELSFWHYTRPLLTST